MEQYKLDKNKINGISFPENSLILSTNYTDYTIRVVGDTSYIAKGTLDQFRDSTGAVFSTSQDLIDYFNTHFNIGTSVSGGVTIEAGDIEIGAVELKDSTTATRANITARGSKGALAVEIVDGAGVQVTQFGDPNITLRDNIREFTYELTRPTDVIGYLSGDVIADSTSAPTLPEWVGAALGSNKGVIILGMRVQTNNTAWAGQKIRVHLYSDLITAINDNDPFSMLYTNAGKRKGYVDFTLEAAEGGSTDSVSCHIDNINKGMQVVNSDIYFVPQVRANVTPASGQKIKFTVIILQTL